MKISNPGQEMMRPMTQEEIAQRFCRAQMMNSIIPTMTDRNYMGLRDMEVGDKVIIQRMVEWANMLERRVAELDENYRAYPFGRIKP